MIYEHIMDIDEMNYMNTLIGFISLISGINTLQMFNNEGTICVCVCALAHIVKVDE